MVWGSMCIGMSRCVEMCQMCNGIFLAHQYVDVLMCIGIIHIWMCLAGTKYVARAAVRESVCVCGYARRAHDVCYKYEE